MNTTEKLTRALEKIKALKARIRELEDQITEVSEENTNLRNNLVVAQAQLHESQTCA